MKEIDGQLNLIEGNIAKGLLKLAAPMMCSSFVQMAYSFVNMIWLGRLDTLEVAAVGTASFFIWLAMMLIQIPVTSITICVSQAVGAKDSKKMNEIIAQGLLLTISLAAIYMVFLLVFNHDIIRYFKLTNNRLIQAAESYLKTMAFFMLPQFLNPVFTGILNGYGNSKLPFAVNLTGIVINTLLDPLLIFNKIPGFTMKGAEGAAIASAVSYTIAMLLFIIVIRRKYKGKISILLPVKVNVHMLKELFCLGLPTGLQSGFFSIVMIIIARYIAGWGDCAIAVQKVGSQIESLTWMTVGSFSNAICSFTGQNYGAARNDRVVKGYFVGLGIVLAIGVVNTIIFFYQSENLFRVFLTDNTTIQMGSDYLKILSISQIFVCMEAVATGALNGIGKTVVPSVISISFTILRIPGVIILPYLLPLGLNGIWWIITFSSIFKGIFLFISFASQIKKMLSPDNLFQVGS